MTDTASQNRRTPVSTPTTGPSDRSGTPTSVWPEILRRLADTNPDLVRGWFFRLKPRKLEHGTLTLDVDNDAQAAYLNARCRDALSTAAQTATGRLITFAFSPTADTRTLESDSRQNQNGNATLDPGATFDSFAVGPCNRLAAAAAHAFADDDSDSSLGLLLLQGPPGTGKTHLLQAICRRVAGSSSARWRYVTAETFCRDWIESIESGQERAFRKRYRELDCLVMDDLNSLSHRERSQEEFFHTLNSLQNLRTRIAVSAAVALPELLGIEPRIRDRLAAGFVTTLELPCRETRGAIVRSLARSRCIDIADAAIAVLIGPDGASAADLAAALAWLDAQSRTSGGRITEGLAREWVGGWAHPGSRRLPAVSPAVTIDPRTTQPAEPPTEDAPPASQPLRSQG